MLFYSYDHIHRLLCSTLLLWRHHHHHHWLLVRYCTLHRHMQCTEPDPATDPPPCVWMLLVGTFTQTSTTVTNSLDITELINTGSCVTSGWPTGVRMATFTWSSMPICGLSKEPPIYTIRQHSAHSSTLLSGSVQLLCYFVHTSHIIYHLPWFCSTRHATSHSHFILIVMLLTSESMIKAILAVNTQ